MKNLFLLLLFATFPLFSLPAFSEVPKIKNIFYIVDEKSNLQAEDDFELGEKAINEIKENGTQVKNEFRISPGFVNGTLWVLIQKDFTLVDSQDFQILDLGPELVDRAELFVLNGENWKKVDSAGRQVKNSKKSIKSASFFANFISSESFVQ